MNETIVFGGGCFWCTEAVFGSLKGVVSVMPGYCEGAEVTKVEYDPAIISFQDLLTVFFYTHDPTTLNRQGADIGTQYRSAIFYTTEAQKTESEQFIKELNESGPKVVTEVTKFTAFYQAEEEHRQFYLRNQNAGYCQVVINPKIEKLKKRFAELLK